MNGSGQSKPGLLKTHGLTLGIVLAVVTGWLLPVAEGDPVRGPGAIGLGVWIVFFVQGLGLPARELLRGYRPLRLPTLVLGWNFLLYPLWAALLIATVGRALPGEIQLGFFLLSVLPTTIASAVSFTTLAGGRVASAVVCTVVSNVLAVFIVPLAAFLYGASSGVEVGAIGKVWWSVARLVLIPLLLGQAVRWAAPGVAARLAPRGRQITTLIIWLIVHVAFARRETGGAWETLSGAMLVWTFVIVVVLLAGGHWMVWRSSAWGGFTPAERITVFFCGSQKALASGLPMILTVLAVSPAAGQAGLVIIPLLIFHPLQLVLAGWLSGRLGLWAQGEGGGRHGG